MDRIKVIMKSIWKDERKYKNRLFIVLPLSFSLFFMVLFYGPLDIILWNQYDAGINYLGVAAPLIVITILGTIITSVMIALLKGFFLII
jgi:hypothetical protein